MKPYYEGWYLKQQQGDDLLAVIPGRAQDHAFVQVITPRYSAYVPFPLSEYRLGACMQVGDSLFSRDGIDLQVSTPEVELEGHLRYADLTPLRSDIMGPFAFLPMETKHTVFSMRHEVQGLVTLNGTVHRFDDGVGYMEGDHGHSFPQGYTWIQSVDLPCDASVMLAVATIPLGPLHFIGCIGIVALVGREYRFATYRGVRIVQADRQAVEVRQGPLRLRVEVPETRGHKLQAPTQGSMRRLIHESPAVPAHFTFACKGKTLLDAESPHTSFEFVEA